MNSAVHPLCVFVGHPYSSIGVGAQLRSHIASAKRLSIPVAVHDIYKYSRRSDPSHRDLVDDVETSDLGHGVRVFHINGDEVSAALNHLDASGQDFRSGYNVIVPAWELSLYPSEWVPELRKFDEIWALSSFIADSLERSGLECHYIGQSAEVPLRTPFLPRRRFGIRDSATVYLTYFDSTSYEARKNPSGALETFKLIREKLPLEDIQLVIKAKAGDRPLDKIPEPILAGSDVVVINEVLNTFEMNSLLACSDILISTHRAEGFGRGCAEAMYLGKVVCATGWSGNLDFMENDNSILVPFDFTPVPPGAYPASEGQFWAEPNIETAARLLVSLYEDKEQMKKIRRNASRSITSKFSDRAVGIRISKRLEELRTSYDQNLVSKAFPPMPIP